MKREPKPKGYRPPFPAGLAFRGGMAVGMLGTLAALIIARVAAGGFPLCP